MHIDIKSAFEQSETLNRHIEGRLLRALRASLRDVHEIVLRLSDANGPRHGANDKIVRISARLRASRPVVITARSADIYRSADRAIDRLKSALTRQIRRLRSRRHRAAAGGEGAS